MPKIMPYKHGTCWKKIKKKKRKAGNTLTNSLTLEVTIQEEK